MEQQGFPVFLLRCSKQGEWVELRKEAVAHVSTMGIVIRENASNSLLADFPISSIQKLERISETIITINFIGNKAAVRFPDSLNANQFYVCAANHQWPIEDSTVKPKYADEFTIPSVEDPMVQEFIFKLLFSEDFKAFVADMKGLLNGMSQQF